MTDQYHRNVAYKYRVGEILLGVPKFNEDKFSHLEIDNKKIIRVNVVGNIVDRYDSQGEKKYTFFTLDDGSGQIKLKTFGDDTEKFKGVSQGQTVVVIGTTRNFNNETYLSPEIIKEQDPKYLLIRKLETQKEKNNTIKEPQKKEEITKIEDQIIKLIKDAEDNGGIDKEKIILPGVAPHVIDQEIKKLLEEGIAFEPRPGKLRYLG
jgi:RPA family protein